MSKVFAAAAASCRSVRPSFTFITGTEITGIITWTTLKRCAPTATRPSIGGRLELVHQGPRLPEFRDLDLPLITLARSQERMLYKTWLAKKIAAVFEMD